MTTGYLYLEHDGEDPDRYPIVTPVESDTLLEFEINNSGIPDHWMAEMKDHPEGYYKVQYLEDEECEHDDCGGVISRYGVLGSLETMTASPIRARLMGWRMFYLDPAIAWITRPFRKVWSVDFDHGGAGLSTHTTWFPKALWIYLFRKESAWGKPVRKELRHYY